MLGARVLSALIGIPLLLIVIWFGNPWFSLAVAGCALWGALEFYNLAGSSHLRPLTLCGVLGTLLFILNAYVGGSYTALLISVAVLFSLIWLLFRSQVEEAFNNWAWTLAGMLYVGWMLSHFILLRGLAQGKEWVILALFSTFAVDTCAFFVGRAWGKHKLAPAISPGKSWEGAVGGLVGGLGASLALALILRLPTAWWQVLLLGLLIGVFAQLGDLSESMLKRSTGVKDAGKLIPGHGGILDRLDSIVFAVVVVYYYVIWVIV
jgi:phosphatidate cytidylyltransferase